MLLCVKTSLCKVGLPIVANSGNSVPGSLVTVELTILFQSMTCLKYCKAAGEGTRALFIKPEQIALSLLSGSLDKNKDI